MKTINKTARAKKNMEFVSNKVVGKAEEIKRNMVILDTYLDGQNEEEYSWAVERIKQGQSFIAVKTKEGYKFYPSRFVGYVNNTMNRHKTAIEGCNIRDERDGKETNQSITKILGQNKINDDLERAYLGSTEKRAQVSGI